MNHQNDPQANGHQTPSPPEHTTELSFRGASFRADERGMAVKVDGFRFRFRGRVVISLVLASCLGWGSCSVSGLAVKPVAAPQIRVRPAPVTAPVMPAGRALRVVETPALCVDGSRG